MPDLVTARPRHAVDEDGNMRVSADIDGAAPLWFSVAADAEELLADRADHVAVALLLPAMRYGRDLRVGGVVTDSLLHRLNHDLQALVRAVHSNYQTIAVTADETIPAGEAPTGVATGFSGGVDSFATLTEYASAAGVPEALRVTHLLNNNVGAHGEGGESLWRRRFEALRPVAAELGLPFIRVDSNIDVHYPRMGFMQTATFRNAAVMHLLGGGIGRCYHASEGAYRNLRMPPPHGDIGLVGAMTFPLLSTAALTVESTSSGMSRIERTLALVGSPYARYLDVCIDADPNRTTNCSRCWKCMRTMLTLEIAGRLDEFVPVVFVRAPYERRRWQYYAELLSSSEPNDRELVEYGDRNGWRWGAAARGRATARRAKRWAHDLARATR
ncbi:hypothetical protein [Microbacterium sp. LWH12-1.2]|uniref:hypothetical protein n=1 Tax=Microbacterium sp. LWH12-1.2 TaxID=3135259 RepID=UPI00342832EB